MFYSHDILTSRKYGVATIWLVATLGSKTSLKKVSRKAILDVNVEKACEAIVGTEVPMALRLQSNLLYGITRVYSQQCGYILSDAESIHNNMRVLVKLLRPSNLDLGVDKNKQDNQILQDDPDFLPEVNLAFDNIDIMNGVEPRSMIWPATGLEFATSDASSRQSQQHSDIRFPTLDDISSSNVYENDLGGLSSNTVRHSAARQAQYEGLQDDLGLVFDDDHFTLEDAPMAQEPVVGTQEHGYLNRPGSVISQPMLTEQNTAEEGSLIDNNDNFDVLNQDALQNENDAPQDVVTAAATAQQRRKRIIKQDHQTQLSNEVLRRWNNEYLTNMSQDVRFRSAMLSRAQAKSNADFWVLGDSYAVNAAIAPFRGQQLLSSLIKLDETEVTSPAAKRAREEREQDRRVRARTEDDHEIVQHDDGNMDYDNEIEVGREPATALEDVHRSSLAPWNLSTGSRRMGSSIARRQQIASASPLHHDPALEDTGFVLHDTQFTSDGFELFGPAAEVDTQTAGDSQWLRSALDGQSTSFFDFCKGTIDDKYGNAEGPAEDRSIAFADLLPTTQQSRIVAAQGLLHVLTLCSRALLKADQTAGFGPITLRLVE